MASNCGEKNRRNASYVWSALALTVLAGTAIGQGAAPAPASPAYQGQPAPAAPNAAPAPAAPAASSAMSGKAAPVRSAGVNHGGPSADDAQAAEEAGVQVDDNLVVDLHVNDEDLGNVLEMLSLQSQRNIIASKNVSARVTANLYGVTFYEALDAILHANGYGFVEDGNFIYVYTTEELNQLEQAQRVRTAKVLRLNYLNSIDAAEFVKPLLSDQGQIKTNGKTGNFPSIGDVPMGADDYTNASTMVVVDFEENIAEVEAMIAQLDTKPSQVLVEATILQTNLNEANAFGVDFALIGDIDFSDFTGGPLQVVNRMISGDDGQNNRFPADNDGVGGVSSAGNTAGNATLKVGLVKDDVAVFLRLLDEVTDSTILSNPKIMSLNRMPSRVLVGRKVGYVSTTSTDTATTQTVQFLDTGTQLYFRPFVTNEGLIRMELKPQVSEAQIREVQSAQGQAITIPDEVTNELVTNVLVADGQTVVLGGLFRESVSATRSQVPVLGDIPIVGAAFRGNEDETNRAEIIFLVTPTIMNDASAYASGQRANQYVERVRAGSRAGTLPWSQSRLTSQWNMEADKAAAQGQTDRANWKLTQSLWLNPNQPEAIRLKEAISGQTKTSANRSMLESVIHNEHATRPKGATADTPAPRQQTAQRSNSNWNSSNNWNSNPASNFGGNRNSNSNTTNSSSTSGTTTWSQPATSHAPATNSTYQQASAPSTPWQAVPNHNASSYQAPAQTWETIPQLDASSTNYTPMQDPGFTQGMGDVDNTNWQAPTDFASNTPGTTDWSEDNTDETPGYPRGASGGFFRGAFRWVLAFASFDEAEKSRFTSAENEPMIADER